MNYDANWLFNKNYSILRTMMPFCLFILNIYASYIDDLYWAATFPKTVKVIEFVIERGPAYGYHLNMKKCIYLMAPTAKKLM